MARRLAALGLSIVLPALALAGSPGAGTISTSGWGLEPTPSLSSPSVVLTAVSCASTTDCTAVGFYLATSKDMATLAEHWNGTQWTI